MYNPMSGCSAFLHLLLKHPILIIAVGITGAVGIVGSQLNDSPKKKTILVNEIKDAESKLGKNAVTEAKNRFDAIKANNGLSNMALKDVLGKIPACQNLNESEIMDNPEMLEQIAFLYFLDLIHQSGNIDIAVLAFQQQK